MGKNLIQKAQQ